MQAAVEEDTSSKTDEELTAGKSSRSSKKRSREENDQDGTQQQENDNDGADETTTTPNIVNGIVEFPFRNIHDFMVCSLCSGYYQEPWTITECQHTYCKTCLFYAVACGCYECPECNVYVGKDVKKFAVLDFSIQALLDRIIFPNLVKEEEQQERIFYASHNIPLKPEYAGKESQKKEKKKRPLAYVANVSTRICS
jgi:hypothetical protein